MANKKKVTRSPASGKPTVHGELRSGPIAGTALIDGATFTQKPVLYAAVDGQAIFEGDIVLGTVKDLQQAQTPGLAPRSIGITGAQFRWPNAQVPYEIDSGLPNQQRVTDAIAHWEAHTRIRFVQRTAANQAQFPDFVRFVSGGGCSSTVGRQGGPQNVTLGPNCSAGNAIHEIGHTIGLWHEQSREDRDSFVTIVWANIDPAMQFNFSQHIQDGDDLGAYDYGSIMHYPHDAFSTNGQDTIVPKQSLPSGVVMGQRTALSAGDLAGVATLYPGATTFKEATKDPVVDTTLKEVSKEPTADTVKEVRKDPVSDTTLKEAGKDPISDTVKEVSKEPTRDTVKEVRKDPIRETVKEVAKDPIRDTTIKEAGLDPGPIPGPVFPGPLTAGSHVSPFVLSTPSRAGVGGTSDPVSDAAQYVQQIEEAIAQTEQQMAQLLEAYDQAVRALQALQGGQ
ncbi:MAG TPA: Dot/Icm T4SS effector Zinc-dependent metalloprotease LegP [Edaphobacter sp.]